MLIKEEKNIQGKYGQFIQIIYKYKCTAITLMLNEIYTAASSKKKSYVPCQKKNKVFISMPISYSIYIIEVRNDVIWGENRRE